MTLERQRFAKYSCKDIFRILLACETLVNNQLDLSHSCLLYRESNSWGERSPSKCSQNVYILQVICYVPASIGAVAKSSHICSSTFLFLGGQSVECRTLHFSVQAKPAHAESVIFVYDKQTCSGFVVLGRLFQAVFGSNSAFPNRPSASRLQSFWILNAVARIKRRVSLLVFTRVRNLPNP